MASSDPSASRGDFYCELCDVSCTSKDAFEAHARGAKHQKVGLRHRRENSAVVMVVVVYAVIGFLFN